MRPVTLAVPLTLPITLLVTIAAFGGAAAVAGQEPVLAPFPVVETGDRVIAPPAGAHPFYEKYINAGGIVIVSSARVPDTALRAARRLVLHLLSSRPDVHRAMLAHHPRISIMAIDETASDLPEFDDGADGQWGLGQMQGDPTTLVSERGVCYPGNEQYRANFLLHEFVHNMQGLGWVHTDPGVNDEIYAAYEDAVAGGRFAAPRSEPMGAGPQRSFGDDEYLTHGVNAWFDLDESLPGPWVDVPIGASGPRSGTRAQLGAGDPRLFEIIGRFLPTTLDASMTGCASPSAGR